MKTRESIYQFGQRNQWLIAVVVGLLLFVSVYNQLHYTTNHGFSFRRFTTDLIEMFQKVFSHALFGIFENRSTYFSGQLSYCIVVFTWGLLIVGIVRYYSQKRSTTVLKFACLLLVWISLFQLIRLLFFWQLNGHYNLDFSSYLVVSYILPGIALPFFFASTALLLLSPIATTNAQDADSLVILNRWQRGLHFFLDRVVMWFCGYNSFLMTAMYTPKYDPNSVINLNWLMSIGISLFMIQLIVLPLFSEGLFGVTIGKLLTGTRVVRTDGTPISLKQAFIRSFIRLIPFNWISVFSKKGLWIDRWSNTQVVVVHSEEPLKRLHKVVQLGTGMLFFTGIWFLVLLLLFITRLTPELIYVGSMDFPFLLIAGSFPFIVLFQSFWIASLLDHFRSERDKNVVSSNDALFRSFYCWIPILNFYYLATHLEEITSHMEHSDSSKEHIDRVGKRIRQFSNVFALIYLFVLGLAYPLWVNLNPLPIATLIILLIMLGCFFAWRLSYTLANLHKKMATIADLLDDLS